MTQTTGRMTARTAKITSLPTAAALAIAVVAAVIGATILNVIIAAIAHAAGASHDFMPLQFSTYTGLTVFGIIIAGLAWTAIRAKAADPERLLRVLVPVVIVLSFIPDVLVGISKSEAHTTWGAVIALMLMHIGVAAAGVFAFRTLLPVPRTRS